MTFPEVNMPKLKSNKSIGRRLRDTISAIFTCLEDSIEVIADFVKECFSCLKSNVS